MFLAFEYGVLYVLSFGTTGSKPSITAAFVKVKWDGEPPLVENMIPLDDIERVREPWEAGQGCC